MPEPSIVQCPTCKKPVEWKPDSTYRPFCSKQCQLMDFGDWADEKNTIAGAPDMSDSDGWSEDAY